MKHQNICHLNSETMVYLSKSKIHRSLKEKWISFWEK